MSVPFRDEMSAAMLRADQLEDENEELRLQLERLHKTADAVKAKVPDDELADQTLAVLEKLAVVSQRRPPVGTEAIVTRVDTTATPERAELPVSAPVPSTLGPPNMDRSPTGWTTEAVVAACIVCLSVGALIGAVLSRL